MKVKHALPIILLLVIICIFVACDDEDIQINDLANVKFEDLTVTYTGEYFSINVTGAPENATITYTPAITSYKDTGRYPIEAYVETPNSKNTYKAYLTINPLVVEEPSIQNSSNAYSGLEQTFNITCNDAYASVSNNKATNVGEYNAICTLKDKRNYTWSDNTIDDKEIAFSITQATNTWKQGHTPYVEDSTYQEDYTISAEATFGNVVITYKNQYENQYSSTKPTEAGTYTAKFHVEETDNYSALDEELTFTIDKLLVALPTISQQTTFTYNGIDQSPISGDLTNIVVEGTKDATDAGNYQMLIYLANSNSLLWDNGQIYSISQSWVIKKATNTVSITLNGERTGNTYNLGDFEAPTAQSTFGTAVIKYYSDSNCDTEIQSIGNVVGTFYIKASVDGTNNYDAASTVVSVIIQEEVLE